MKIVFTAKGLKWDSMMDSRFGRTEYFLIYDEEKDELSYHDNSGISNNAHGAGPKTAQQIYELNPEVLITGNGPGDNAAKVLKRANIIIYTGAGNMKVSEAYKAFKNHELQLLNPEIV